MTGPDVSVIVSTRNRAHYLPEVLGTLAAQATSASFEVVVIDNGSSDGTPALLDEWCRKDPRFRTACEPRAGLSRGKNAGIRLARGSLLLFTDDDVRVDRHWIDSYRRLFEQQSHALTIAGGPIVPMPHDLGAWPRWLDESALVDAFMLNYVGERRLDRFEYVWGGNMAAPRTLFDRVGLWDETAGLQGEQRVTREDSDSFEDTAMQDRVREAEGSVWFCPAAVVQHRVARHSVTPRRVTSNAFARGRNEFWQENLRAWQEVERVPRRNALLALAGLTHSLARWAFWLVMFRLAVSKGFFERARSAAYSSGRSLDSLRAGRKSMRLYLGAARIAFPARNLLQRLAPDVS
ncbi:MAG TPA: glycosyltransferase [Gemmatimonadaceae bacterium]|nr:glycosyltransferase [Gemmatimonadaceae bacterium]